MQSVTQKSNHYVKNEFYISFLKFYEKTIVIYNKVC